ncbi:MAG: bifunctional metallophosphatase/5'-nucleotidase [Deltaproteobacteria bacterium]|nr:bifunctional metallophosphatase/5'-nucleotidase [Deltaproteobacteria bacterium]
MQAMLRAFVLGAWMISTAWPCGALAGPPDATDTTEPEAQPPAHPSEAPGLEPAEGSTGRLTVLFATDLYGRFAEVSCGAAPEADFSNMVGAIDGVRKELEAAGLPAPLVLNGGDNIGPRAFARFVLSAGSQGGAEIASWLKRAGFDAVALGNQDFFAVLERLEVYLQEGKKAGLVFTAANLDCADAQAGLCPSIGAGPDRFVMLERSGIRIAVLSVIHGDLAVYTQANRLKGIQVKDPYERARQVVERARARGADLVVILSHLDHSETAPRRALKLAQAVPDADLIIGNSFTSEDRERRIGVIRFADGASPIVGCDLFGEHLCRTDLQLERREGRWRVAGMETRELDVKTAPPDLDVQAQIRKRLESYCASWDKPVGDGQLAKPMSAEVFRDYLLEVMRQSTSSEMAFVNEGLVNPRTVFPIEGHLTRHDFFSALPHRNPLFVFELTGAQVAALCGKLQVEEAKTGKTQLVSRGLKCEAGKQLINGRLVTPADRYKAVTIDYLARGTLGYFEGLEAGMHAFRPDPAEDPPILGEVARAFLLSPRFRGAAAERIDLETNFADLGRKLRWTFAGGVSLNLTDTTISNLEDSPYTESQLARDEFMGLKGELRGEIGADSQIHEFGLDARMRYARSSTAGGDWIESEDLTTLNGVYKLKALRDADSAWYVPMPYVEAMLETELTRPEDDPATEEDEDRGYHHLELTATLGARFKLWDTLEAKLGFGVRKELLDDDSDAVYGFDVGYRLKKTQLFSLLGSPFHFESEASAFFGDVGRSNTLKGTWTNRIYFALVGPIYFNITHDLFVYRYSTWGYGLASDLTFGLSYNAQAAVQTF